MNFTHPTAALLTPRGRGAIAAVRLHGPPATLRDCFTPANGIPLEEQPAGRVVFGRWGAAPGEELVVCRADESVIEIHSHGGAAAVRRILDDLTSRGVEVVSWQTMQSNECGAMQAEIAGCLALATTERTADILLQQSTALPAAVSKLREAAAADWSPESRRGLEAALDELLGRSEFGEHLTRPWEVVLCGRPNVGKSSLINALVGYNRSIVFDRPGTTRDAVAVETALEGWPVRLTDTAGLRDTADALEAEGISRARSRIAASDCRLLLLDVGVPRSNEDARLLAEIPDAILIAHKSDLPNAWGGDLPTEALRVSSKTRCGVSELCAAIVARLFPVVPAPGTAIPCTLRQSQRLAEARDAARCADFGAFRDALDALSLT